jgi:two-component system chemotaxis response regulator CheB
MARSGTNGRNCTSSRGKNSVLATARQPDRSWHNQDAGFDVVAMAASAGGLRALNRILAELPSDFPVPVVVVQHISPYEPSLLADILARRTALQVKQGRDGDLLRPATVYVPVPARHMLVRADGTPSVFQAAPIQYVRPSADLLLESVSRTFGGRAVAVVLTGMGQDGANGIQAVRREGGFVIAQDAATAEHSDMPYAAIETRMVDLVLPLHHIGFALRLLVEGAGASKNGANDKASLPRPAGESWSCE